MKRSAMGFVTLCLIALMVWAPPALAGAADYAGEWTCAAIDTGDGVKRTEYEGMAVGDVMKIDFREDGTLTVTSMGASIEGTWSEAEGGVSAEIDGEAVDFALADGQLVNDSGGTRIYLEKAARAKKSGGLLGVLKANRYPGKWVATGVDLGDGEIVQEVNGMKVAGAITLTLSDDGTLVMTSMGYDVAGSWAEIEGGIAVTIDGETTEALYRDGKLSATDEGQTMYFERAESVEEAPAPTPAPAASGFAGTWTAVKYETGGYWYDPSLLFPDGSVLTLNGDGTGSATITADYAEVLTWAEADGGISIAGGYVLSDAQWDSASGELRLKYGASEVYIVYVKGDAPADALPAEYGLIEDEPEPEAEPTPEPAPEVTPEPVDEPEPTDEPGPAEGAPAFEYASPLFQASFPEGWTSDEYNFSTGDTYCSVKYEKKDADGITLASVMIYASSESVDSYRDKIKRLTEYAQEAGGALEEKAIGGIGFLGASYENWGWNYTEYAARAPESRITVVITIERPENAEGKVDGILDSIAFTLPALDPPNVDPPMPEDGVPYEPATGSAAVGQYTLKAQWLQPDGSIVLDSIFGNQIALAGQKLYVLTGKRLYAYSVKDLKLAPDKVFEGGVMKLDDSFEALSAGKDGVLYVSQGIFNTLALKDGKLLKDNPLSGDLAMHPGGEWGVSFWANADTKKVKASRGTLTEEPWVLADLSDPSQRKGRFSMISCVYISEARVYVAGSDAENGDAQRIAVYDLDGKELFTFGALEWTDEDAFGSVTGIVETENGILVQDGNYRAYKLFDRDGAFLGAVDSDALLGTSYPWLSSMIPADGGAYVAAAQRREDESCDELLLFKLSGF